MIDRDINAFDSYIRLAIHAHSTPGLTVLMAGITILGTSFFLYIVSTAVAAALWRRGLRDDATYLAIVILGASILNMTLKLFFHRDRPQPFFGLAIPDSYSFPSGHALESMCGYGSMAELLSKQVRSRALRVIVWVGAAVIVLLVGISRVYLGVHYPSDVVGGYVTGIVWLVGVHLIRRRAS